MIIAHVSDLHVFAGQPESRLVRPDAVARAARVIADLAALRPAPSAVVISGDLADCGTADDYAVVETMLRALPMAVLAVPGNHDRRETMRAALERRVGFVPGEFLNVAREIGPLRLIGLDTTIPGRAEGALCAERLDWLRATLAQGARPALIALHHAPFPTGAACWDRIGLRQGAPALAEIVAAHPAPVRLLSGHVHHPMHAVWAGALATIAGSPAFQFAHGLPGEDEPKTAADAPYCYWLHRIDPAGTGPVIPRFVALD
jgi:Icc protein